MSKKNEFITEFTKFRLLTTPCCHTILCWVNPRMPNFCPECGTRVYSEMKTNREKYVLQECDVMIKMVELP